MVHFGFTLFCKPILVQDNLHSTQNHPQKQKKPHNFLRGFTIQNA